MPEVTFGSPEGAASVPTLDAEVVVESPATPATPAIGVPATVPSPGAIAPTGLLLGDRIPEFKDIIMPRVNLVQGTGQLKDSFPQGAIIHGQNLVIFEPPIIDPKTNAVKKAGTAPVSLIVCGLRPTRYVEKIGNGERGMLCNTEDEVRAAGGTLDYNEWKLNEKNGMRRFENLADALVLIERPESCADDDTVFIYEVDGKKYALALWSLKGSAYTAVVKRVLNTNRLMGYLRKGFPSVVFHVSSRSEKAPGGASTYYVPVFLPGVKTSPPLLEFVAGILNPV